MFSNIQKGSVLYSIQKIANDDLVPDHNIVSFDKNHNKIIIKERSISSKYDILSYKEIIDKTNKETLHPTIKKIIADWLRLSTENGHRNLTKSDFKNLHKRLIKLDDEFANKTYVQEISHYANNSHLTKTFQRLGINPKVDYDPTSKNYTAIIEKLVEKKVDLFPSVGSSNYDNAIRHVNAAILDTHENEILSNIDKNTQKDPNKFLKALTTLKNNPQYNQYVLDKLIAQAEVWKIMQNNPKLKDFPFKDIWRFCIDVDFQKHGAYIFENEPGYIISTLKALALSLKTQKPTHFDYIAINKQCGENVQIEFIDNYHGRGLVYLSTEVRYDSVIFTYPTSKTDPEGLKDLQERSEIENNFFTLSNNLTMDMRPISYQENIRKMMFLFEEHDKKILASKNKIDRILAHIWLARELELHHHFGDGNGRTSHLLLLSLIANDPHLPMMLLDTDVNLIDSTGPIATLKRVIQGMENFNELCGITTPVLNTEEMKSIDHLPKEWKPYHPSEKAWANFELKQETIKQQAINGLVNFSQLLQSNRSYQLTTALFFTIILIRLFGLF